MTTTVFVLVSDEAYLYRAKKTIIDLRSTGNYKGPIVLINVNMRTINQNFLDFYNIIEKKFIPIEQKTDLVRKLNYSPFLDTIDGREISKTNQWEKLHVMDSYFKQWDRVVFLDAGLRILSDVNDSLLSLDYKNKFLAPDDGGNYIKPNPDKLFETQISLANPSYLALLKQDFPKLNDFKEPYFLNCVWVYDTAILDIVSKDEMMEGMLKYPICKTNEMALMNLYIHFKYGLWTPFPKYSQNNKILFDWCELNSPHNTSWRDYCILKYPVTITLEDT